jgi:hypothetical protein
MRQHCAIDALLSATATRLCTSCEPRPPLPRSPTDCRTLDVIEAAVQFVIAA